MSLLEDLPIELVERAISMFVRNASLAEALRALNTCKTFRNLIFHHIIEKMSRRQFVSRSPLDSQIIHRFLHYHLEILLKRRSKFQSTTEWVYTPLFDAFTSILKLEGCSTQDKRGKAFEEKLITYLGTLAKRWTIQRLIEEPIQLPYRPFKRETIICTAIVVGNIDTVRKLFESRDMVHTFFHETYRILYKHGHDKHGHDRNDRNFHKQFIDFRHPIFEAISIGDLEILQFLLKELFRFRIHSRISEGHRAYLILRLVINMTKTQAIIAAHDQLIGHMSGYREIKYFCLIILAATTGDITTFRTVIHLYATKPRCSGVNLTYAQTCQDAHEDVIWFILKRALVRLSEDTILIHNPPKEDIRCLIRFILAHYDVILMETAVPSHEALVPVWKKKVPSKQDLIDRNPLLIEQAIIAVGSQTVSKTASYETIGKKEDHAMLACGASAPPKY